MEKRCFILHWILLFYVLIFCIDSKPVFESGPQLRNDALDESSSLSEPYPKSKDGTSNIVTNVYPTSSSEYAISAVTENGISVKSNDSVVKNYSPSPNFQETNSYTLSDRFLVENYTSYSITKDLPNASNNSLDENASDTQPLTSEISIKTPVSQEFFFTSNVSESITDSIFNDPRFSLTDDVTKTSTLSPTTDALNMLTTELENSVFVTTNLFEHDTDSVFNDSRFSHIDDASEASTVSSTTDALNILPIASEISVSPSNDSYGNGEPSSAIVSVLVSSSSLETEEFSDTSTILLINDTFYEEPTSELPVTDTSDSTDIVSVVGNSDQTDSSDLTTEPSSGETIINLTFNELEQQVSTTKLPAKSTSSQSDIFTTHVAYTTSQSSTKYSEATSISSTTKLLEDTSSSQVPDTTEIISTDTTSLGSTTETSNTTEGDTSVCNVCQNCTDGYIDRVISDVTAGLPNSLELPNRQGRFQLYHGQLFGLKTLKRSERALVACLDKHYYAVMVPLRIQNAKAFYKWQVEMPLRTFYGDLNVTVANTECRVFYSHSKHGSMVDGLKITALEGIETEFSGMGPLNDLLAGFTRSWISLFKRSFARTIENTLVHVINKELQDVKKYKEFYDIKR